MLSILPGIIVSYLIGSIPTAFIFGRLLKGIDIRQHGSGNVGATNALRTLGTVPGIIVLLLDVIKGIIPIVMIAQPLIHRTHAAHPDLILILLGISGIIGHNWTCFLNFKGGKGIATTLGVLIGLATAITGLRVIILLLLGTWIVVFAASRIVSLASIIAALSLPVYLIVFKQSKVILTAGFILTIFVLLRHSLNFRRLIRGEEKPLIFKKS
ncbi:MAG TPA: glycerol-3-phosphate 1-O-acyltransferase PlsY [Candidatus Omnitrophota bacterium]|nr:glycerol-3-phosphate 1-O-acyltransferase PlsY [Candidatus Omnitrophota bacterium]HRZ15061.1 glycerol-3-phosphate 1-O-acyltransferase PlsY [Candidatus Omnitrophota bacterium]